MSNRHKSYNEQVELKSKSVINGYVRKVQDESFTNDLFYRTIPMVINYLCMKFYHEPKDRFHPELHGADITATDTIITKSIWAPSSAFLSNIVSKGKHHWKFKIWRLNGSTLAIGVWDNKYNLDQVFNEYLFRVQDALYCVNFNHQVTEGQNKQIRYGKYLLANRAIIDMYLDLDTLDLSFAIDNTHFGTAYKIRKGASYRACVCMMSDEAKLELLMYQPQIR